MLQIVNEARRRLSTDYHLAFRLFKLLMFLGVIACLIILSNLCKLSLMDLIMCCLAFIPTGWGLLLVSLIKCLFGLAEASVELLLSIAFQKKMPTQGLPSHGTQPTALVLASASCPLLSS